MSDRAAVYCRISDDRAGLGLGVDRQRADCLALADAKGMTVVNTWTDNDISAYSGKLRPAYQQLMGAIEARLVDVVVAWHPDRLHRSPVELEGFIAAVERANVRVETVQAGQWDLSTPSGRFMARQLGGVARYESEHKSERVRRALEQNATRGIPHGRPSYGWTRTFDPDGRREDHVNLAEADVVRRIARQIIAGHSMRSITNGLNADNIPAPRGGEWSKVMVRHVVLRERNVGLRVHRGQVIGEGSWPPILDLGEWEQVRAVLQDPARRVSSGSQAVHLLSGIARCGVCGATMRVAMNRTVESYRCSASSCVSRRKVDVEEYVVGAVLGRLAKSDAAALLAPDSSDSRRVAAEEARTIRARLDTAADDFADGKIDSRQLERITARLRPELEAVERRARTVDDYPLLNGLVGEPRAAEVWNTLPLGRRRAVINALVVITVNRTRPGARVFDPQSVTLEWR